MTNYGGDMMAHAWARVRDAEDREKKALSESAEIAHSRARDAERKLDFVRRCHHDALLWLARTNADLERRLEAALRKFDAAEVLRRAIDDVIDISLDDAAKAYDRVPPPPTDKILYPELMNGEPWPDVPGVSSEHEAKQRIEKEKQDA